MTTTKKIIIIIIILALLLTPSTTQALGKCVTRVSKWTTIPTAKKVCRGLRILRLVGNAKLIFYEDGSYRITGCVNDGICK